LAGVPGELFSGIFVYTVKDPGGIGAEKEDGVMKRRSFAVLLALLLVLTLTACGGKGGEIANTSPMEPGSAAMDMGVAESEAPSEMQEYDEAVNAVDDVSGGALREVKMIHTASLSLETTAFDDAVSELTRLTESLGGYCEHSSVWSGSNGYRWADYVVRMPVERYQEFLSQAGELCHVTGRDTSQQNISEAYYDTEGRLKTQQIKLERLQTLLAKADNMADIITIESAISETEWMIEDLSGTLRHYDAQVDYATVNLSLREVYKLSNVEDAPQSFAGRLGSAFASGCGAFLDTLENLAVALAYGWMWVLLLAAVLVLVVRALRKRRRERVLRREKQDDKSEKT